jgi:hypothetical protein
MRLNLKHYKFEKTKKILKTQGFLIISVGCFKTLKDTRKHKLTCFLVKNNICKIIFENSIFNYFKFLLSSSVILVKLNFCEANYFKKLKNLNVIGIKIYDKIYSLRQLAVVNDINYIKSIKVFCMLLKKSILNIYLKLIKI